MKRESKTWLISMSLGAVMALCVLMVAIVPVLAADQESSNGLVVQVNQLAEGCQNAESLSAKLLQETIASCDTLSDAVMKSALAQKKLLLIRLKKSRSLCTYFLQLKQNK